MTRSWLAHNGRHPVTGSPVAKVIHNFRRADAHPATRARPVSARRVTPDRSHQHQAARCGDLPQHGGKAAMALILK